MKILVSGGFDPLHFGHIKMMKECAKLGEVIVAVNSDEWLMRKKGFAYFNREERKDIIESLEYVKEVIFFNDEDGTCIDALKISMPDYFANGGDRQERNTPELDFCKKNNIEAVFSAGGDNKYNSSSEIAKRDIVQRKWGSYRTLHEEQTVKIKELLINMGKGISLQKHHHRAEIWSVEKGSLIVEIDGESKMLKSGDTIEIKKEQWHTCLAVEETRIIEIQKGEIIDESDIIRKD